MTIFGDQSLNVSMEWEVIKNSVICPEIEIDNNVSLLKSYLLQDKHMIDEWDKSWWVNEKEQVQSSTIMQDKSSEWINSTSWNDNTTAKIHSDVDSNKSNNKYAILKIDLILILEIETKEFGDQMRILAQTITAITVIMIVLGRNKQAGQILKNHYGVQMKIQMLKVANLLLKRRDDSVVILSQNVNPIMNGVLHGEDLMAITIIQKDLQIKGIALTIIT